MTAGLHREHWQCNDGAGARRRDATHTRAREAGANALLSLYLVRPQNPKSCYNICQIEYLRFVYGTLNVDEKKTNCTI